MKWKLIDSGIKNICGLTYKYWVYYRKEYDIETKLYIHKFKYRSDLNKFSFIGNSNKKTGILELCKI